MTLQLTETGAQQKKLHCGWFGCTSDEWDLLMVIRTR